MLIIIAPKMSTAPNLVHDRGISEDVKIAFMGFSLFPTNKSPVAHFPRIRDS